MSKYSLKKSLKLFALFILLFFSFNFNAYAQTRNETLNWLKEKINMYNEFSGTTFHADGVLGNVLRSWSVEYEVDDDYILTIYETYSGDEDSGEYGRGYADKYVVDLKKIYSLGINKLGGIYNHDLNSRYGILDYFNLITYANEVEYTHVNSNDDSVITTHVRSCPLIIMDSSEDDFYARCSRALNNLIDENNAVNDYKDVY